MVGWMVDRELDLQGPFAVISPFSSLLSHSAEYDPVDRYGVLGLSKRTVIVFRLSSVIAEHEAGMMYDIIRHDTTYDVYLLVGSSSHRVIGFLAFF